jgi:hypothetical protein
MQFDQLKRRELISLFGGAAATWPLAARAQQPAMPVQQASQGHGSPRWTGFRQGLNEIGPTIVLLMSWTCRSQTAYRNGRFVAQQTVENR